MESFARAFKDTDIGQRNARHLQQQYEKPPDQLFDPLVRKKCDLVLSSRAQCYRVNTPFTLRCVAQEKFNSVAPTFIDALCWQRLLSFVLFREAVYAWYKATLVAPVSA